MTESGNGMFKHMPLALITCAPMAVTVQDTHTRLHCTCTVHVLRVEMCVFVAVSMQDTRTRLQDRQEEFDKMQVHQTGEGIDTIPGTQQQLHCLDEEATALSLQSNSTAELPCARRPWTQDREVCVWRMGLGACVGLSHTHAMPYSLGTRILWTPLPLHLPLNTSS
jgi:hypothetical protein